MPSETRYELLPTSFIRKVNFLITAVYRCSLTEEKIISIMLSQINRATVGEEGSLTISISCAELKNIFNISGNSIYKNLDMAAKKIMTSNRTIGYTDAEKKEFVYISTITKAECKKGIFTIRFAPEMTEYLMSRKNPYTMFKLEYFATLKSVYSLRLYENLKSKCYEGKITKKTEDGEYVIKMSVAELKLKLGVVDATREEVKTILLDSGYKGIPDYDKAVNVCKEEMYKSQEHRSQFKTRCIDKAVKEINEKTDIYVTCKDYEDYSNGQKKDGYVFYVRMKKSDEIESIEKMDEEDIYFSSKDMIFGTEVMKRLKIFFTAKQLKILGILSDCDADKISGAYEQIGDDCILDGEECFTRLREMLERKDKNLSTEELVEKLKGE